MKTFKKIILLTILSAVDIVCCWDQKLFEASVSEEGSYGFIEKQKWFGIDDLTYYRVRIKVAEPGNNVRVGVSWMHNGNDYSSVLFSHLESEECIQIHWAQRYCSPIQQPP